MAQLFDPGRIRQIHGDGNDLRTHLAAEFVQFVPVSGDGPDLVDLPLILDDPYKFSAKPRAGSGYNCYLLHIRYFLCSLIPAGLRYGCLSCIQYTKGYAK